MNKAGGRHHFRWRVKAQRLSRLTRYALGLPQDETERLLVEHLAGRARPRSDLADHAHRITVTPTHTTAVVRRSDGTKDTISARWVVGADGARSPVRHALGIDFTGATYSQTHTAPPSPMNASVAMGRVRRTGALRSLRVHP
jgi:2-polyprenyl-6-methoxyphenol hydroxylase-like FAD-dependent oxidoreductase